MKFDPFYIFGIMMMVAIFGYVLVYLPYKAYKWAKLASKVRDTDARAWARVIMNPEGPIRPTPEQIDLAKKAMLDEKGRKRKSPWKKRIAIILAITAVVSLIQITGVYDFTSPFRTPPPIQNPTNWTAVIKPVSYDIFVNLSNCQGWSNVTRLDFVNVDGRYGYTFFDSKWEPQLNQWYEIRYSQSTMCVGIFYHILAVKLVGQSPPPTSPSPT